MPTSRRRREVIGDEIRSSGNSGERATFSADYGAVRHGLNRVSPPSRSKSPLGRGARVREIGAVGTGADRAGEMLAELWLVLTDPGNRLADGAGHTGSSAFGRGGRPSITTTQANRAR